ncbi:MAG: phage holin family protein [Synechococcus sp. ELA057]
MSGSAFAKVSALLASVMDVHVRLALQEMGREKRRLIGGGLFLTLGLTLLSLALLALHLVLLLWLRQRFSLDWGGAAAVMAAIDLVLSGFCLRIGGQLLRGPYLPETTAGLMRTSRAITGRT